MIAERHYDDETLLALVEEGEAGVNQIADPHLASCAACGETFRALQAVPQMLSEEAVWSVELPDAPSPRTAAVLRTLASRMAEEDVAAERYVRQLLSMPRERWSEELERNPNWHTGGMVRKLIEASDRLLEESPPSAVEITRLALAIADEVAVVSDGRRLLIEALREHSYALYYTGDFVASRKTLLRSLPLLDRDRDAFQFARALVMQSLLNRALEKLDEALANTREAARVFSDYASWQRFAASKSAEGSMFVSRRQYAEALRIYSDIEQRFRVHAGPTQAAVFAMNVGLCLRELGEFDRADGYLLRAAQSFEAAGVPTELARVHWNRASLLSAQGRFTEALDLLRSARKQFDTLMMVSESALSALDIVEILLAQGGAAEELRTLCRASMASFQKSGLSYSTRALTALGYLSELVDSARVTPAAVKHVRSYIRALPHTPHLLFLAPPPS